MISLPFFRRLVTCVCLVAIPTSLAAQGAVRTCATNEEAEALVTYVLPATIRALSQRCQAVLPATSGLIQAGTITAARYQPDADRAWPDASRAFDRISGLPASALMGESLLKPLVEKTISGEISRNLKLKDCSRIDRLINILQPLPAKNMAMLVVLIIESSGSNAVVKAPVPLCSTLSAVQNKGSISK